MPALKPTDHYGTVRWMGLVRNREAGLDAESVSALTLGFAGPDGEDHGGLTRASCSRVSALYPKGTEIRNTRQLSVLSSEELEKIAAKMGVARVDPTWLGANLVVEGIADFSHLPPSSRLQAESGATLVVDMENRPCHLPAPVIDADPAGAGKGALFRAAAKGMRGITVWVEREGELRLGERLRLHIPDQPAWRG